VNARSLIVRKRRGERLSGAEIEALVHAYTRDEVPDYQMSAFLMAVVWRGMDDEETVALTRAMISSGRTLSFDDLHPTADKHSTGGVGDKVSIALAPLAASIGLHVPMLSGRGLGHTGGTLDKLEAIPGFETRLSSDRFGAILREVGCVMGGQSGDLAPADGKMYALRDATGTVESLPLIVSSILSKKVAAGPDVLVLDVKVGRGAFMPDVDQALALARGLVSVGTRLGKTVVAFLTDMDVPLGRAIGNALETAEAIDLLRGRDTSPDLRELTLLLTATMAVAAGTSPDLASARGALESAIASGRAYDTLRRLVTAHGGDAAAIDADALPRAPRLVDVLASRDGVVDDIDPRMVADLVVDLGGGRRVMTDRVDPAVGVVLRRRPADPVSAGETLLQLHLPQGADEALLRSRAESAIRITEASATRTLIHRVVGVGGDRPWEGWSTPLPLRPRAS
jgi:pyrimidine-nucleoside phosphorylase